MIQDRRVLVLEDEPVVAFLLEDMLREEGAAEVTIASRVAEAEAAIANGNFDLALLDVNVHGERSYPVARQLLAAGVPFLFASGYGDHEHPEVYKSVPTLTKPFTAAELRKAVAKVPQPPAGLRAD